MLNPFAKPTIESKVNNEIEDTKRALLESLQAVEWAQSQVDYNTRRLNRLLNDPINMGLDVAKAPVLELAHA